MHPARSDAPIPRWLCAAVVAVVSFTTMMATTASELRRSPAVVAVEKAMPAVVDIHGQKNRLNGMGTGVIVDERGYILTNFHVVDGVRQIEVTLADKTKRIARLIAHDRDEDLAIIKVETSKPLSTITLGDSGDLMPAETVIAIGNAYGYEHTVTQGIVSSLHRDVQVSDTQSYEDLIQTSAPINPGNSGGPLLNIDGEMIGLNVAVRSGAQNIAFAIPINRALEVATRLMSVERLGGTWHGMLVDTSAASDNRVVDRVSPGSPAASGGIKPGDEIRRIDGRPIQRALDIERAFLGIHSGETAKVQLVRNGNMRTVEMTLTRRGRSAPKKPTTPLDGKTWDVFGFVVQTVKQDEFNKFDTPYNGGLKILKVQNGGAADRAGMQVGDVLVGMNGWETASNQDIRYISNLSLQRLVKMGPIRFWLIRDGDTLYGNLRVASQTRQATLRR